ncbi:MAG: YggS family pyridoxal phosphate-dependent enzyme [Clostridia bacterium]|nr:YggS family pyridoxal phosphate-dependent enzyme [Clostridia bacterium]
MVKDNVQRILEEVNAITKENGIGQPVTLVAVTKNQPADVIPELYDAGVRNFAENRVIALAEKAELMNGTRHLIGHLQTNKVKKALAYADLIHSVDSFHLAKEIDRCSAIAGKITDILIQVNVAEEEQKFGISVGELDELLRQTAELPNLRIRGLMAIMPIDTKDYYIKMYELYRHYTEQKPYGITMDILSMGMSSDYRQAVRFGSNMIRVGTALYL